MAVIARLMVAVCVSMLVASRCVVCLAEAKDAHDELVYARYNRVVAAGKIEIPSDRAVLGGELKHTELTLPATKEDVAAGRAVFTFEGLGERRVWKLPECPIHAYWVGLKQFPHPRTEGEPRYDEHGYVVQAEELLVDGKWKRYFGFVCKHGLAVVPADTVDLSLPAKMVPPGTDRIGELPAGISWYSSGPHQVNEGKRIEYEFAGGRPILLDVYIANRRGAPTKMPTDFYRDAAAGPALVEGLAVQLGFAPFKAATPKSHYPDYDDFTPLKPKRRSSFPPTPSARTLEYGKWFKAFTIDLTDWFEIKKPGHYQFQFQFDAAAMGLPKEQHLGGHFAWGFSIGTPPRRLTAAEMNENIPQFGGRVTEAQLRELIARTVKPRFASSTSSGKKAGKDLPAFRFHDPNPFGGNRSLLEPRIESLYFANWEPIATLDDYEPASLLEELERRLSSEKDREMKFVLASLAAARGSKSAALLLLESMQSTDSESVLATHFALRHVLYERKADQPDWIVEMVLAALADRRYVPEQDSGDYELLTVAYYAEEDADLMRALGDVKCRKAVSFLIQRCEETHGAREPVMALGSIGDQRAVPVLLECLRRAGKTVEYRPETVYGYPDEFLWPVFALADLKARQAVPDLLAHVAFPVVIESLGEIGDARAVEPLEKLVAAGGRITEDGREVYPDLASRRVIAARIALACLEEKNSVARLCSLLGDEGFGEFDRLLVVWRLGDGGDPRAIPALVKAIKTDPSGVVVNRAITQLAAFKYKAAVDGLIECFDADFEGKANSKGPFTPEMFRASIAGSLQKITGRKLGPDKQAWLDWWSRNRNVTKEIR